MTLLSKGFRPFFLLGAVFAALVVPLWLGVLTGSVRLAGPLAGTLWHAHEMIFGFTAAVLAGFLLTAVGNWTGRPTTSRLGLLVLVAVWISGRIAMAAVPGPIGSLVDLLFVPALAATIARPLVSADNRRNMVFPALLAALWTTNLAVHLDAHGAQPGIGLPALRLAIYVIVAIILVVTGRVVPMFTRSATGAEVTSVPAFDAAAIVGVLLVAATTTAGLEDVVPWIAVPAAAAVVARASRWGFPHTLRDPLLWVLHVGHGWVAIGLLLEAGAALGWMPRSLAIHALTVGSIGMLTLGMMARVALGHTGRPLTAHPAIAAAFAAVLVAAAVRVLGPLLVPERVVAWWWIAGLAWTGAFAVYVLFYAPILVRPRADGRPD